MIAPKGNIFGAFGRVTSNATTPVGVKSEEATDEANRAPCSSRALRHTGNEGGISMSELTCLELSVLLWVAHALTQSVTSRAEFGLAYSFTPRDTQPTPKGLAWGRATRAFHNYVENLGPFVAMALALIAKGHTGGLGVVGATIWIVVRPLSPGLCDGRHLRAHCAVGRFCHQPLDDAGPSGVVLSRAALRKWSRSSEETVLNRRR